MRLGFAATSFFHRLITVIFFAFSFAPRCLHSLAARSQLPLARIIIASICPLHSAVLDKAHCCAGCAAGGDLSLASRSKSFRRWRCR